MEQLRNPVVVVQDPLVDNREDHSNVNLPNRDSVEMGHETYPLINRQEDSSQENMPRGDSVESDTESLSGVRSYVNTLCK